MNLYPNLGVVIVGCVTLLVACLSSGRAFDREKAIERGRADAAQSAPEFGIIESRIDSLDAELITRGEAEERFGGREKSPADAKYVWWVEVNGKFVFESMPNLSGRPIFETDRRQFVYDAESGEMIMSGSIETPRLIGTTPFPTTSAITPTP